MCKRFSEIISVRYIFVTLASMGFAIIYGLKINLGVAIVRMINHTAITTAENTVLPELMSESRINVTSYKAWKHSIDELRSECYNEEYKEDKNEDGPFLWSTTIQGVLKSAYFWGYMVSQIPGGRAAELLSAKWVMFFAVGINVICTLLSPLAAKVHHMVFLMMRIAQGLGGGVTFPAMHVMLAKWSPPEERALMSSITYAGTSLGTVIFFLASGIIASTLGWEAIFYIEGGVSAIWLFLWILLVTDSPKTHSFMSETEKLFISSAQNPGGEERVSDKKAAVPWKSVLTSLPFIAILVAHTCSNWGHYMCLIELPLYMKTVLKFKITASAVLTSIPYLGMWLFSIILSKLLTTLETKERISVTTSRKIGTLVASVVPALCFTALCFIECNKVLAVVIMTIAVTAIGGMFSGFLCNHIDISPNFAGTLMGITNTMATIPGIIVPIFVGKLIESGPPIVSWRVVFSVTIVLYIIEVIVYMLFGSAEEQKWNKV